MAGLELVTGPTSDPVSLAEAKAHCRIDHSDDDGLLAGYILAARQLVERDTSRALMEQTWRAFFDRCWPSYFDGRCYRPGIVLPMPPLVSVVSISYVDTVGVTQTLGSDQYRVARFGHRGLIEPAYGVTWPPVRPQLDAITVEFVAGYGSNPGDIPEPIRQALLLLIGHFYEHREAVNVGSAVNEMPFAVDALLGPYRVFG